MGRREVRLQPCNYLMPQAVYIFMKPNRGAYDANVVYTKLTYRF